MIFQKAGDTQVVNPTQTVNQLKWHGMLKRSKSIQAVMSVLPSLETYFE